MHAAGEFLREELGERKWTQADLARIIGRPVQVVNLIVTGKKAITAQTALQIAAALGPAWQQLKLFRIQSSPGGGPAPASQPRPLKAAVAELEKRQQVAETVVEVDAQLLESCDMLIEHILEINGNSMAEHNGVGYLHHGGLEVQ